MEDLINLYNAAHENLGEEAFLKLKTADTYKILSQETKNESDDI